MRDVFEVAVVADVDRVGGGGRLCEQGVDLVYAEYDGAGQCGQAGEVAHRLLRGPARRLQAPPGAFVAGELVGRGVGRGEVGLADVLQSHVRRGEQYQRAKGVTALAHRVAAHLGQRGDEIVERLGRHVLVADHRSAGGA